MTIIRTHHLTPLIPLLFYDGLVGTTDDDPSDFAMEWFVLLFFSFSLSLSLFPYLPQLLHCILEINLPGHGQRQDAVLIEICSLVWPTAVLPVVY